jgi:mRNA interferase RelE/StbE
MVWKIVLDPSAQKDLHKLDSQYGQRIERFLFNRVATLNNPRSIGEPLTEPRLNDLWRYRAGDYRIMGRIEDGSLTISVVKIDHRRKVYL